MKKPTFHEVYNSSWDFTKDTGSKLTTHCFRGQANETWKLSTSLERAADQFRIPINKQWSLENIILSLFKQRAHHYISSPPNMSEDVEWLALLRHYGGVSRLLDVTYSFYIAAFFAMEDATTDACVWAFKKSPLLGNLYSGDRVEKYFANDPPIHDTLFPFRNIAQSYINFRKQDNLGAAEK